MPNDQLEKRVIALHQDKERLLYWLCRAYQHEKGQPFAGELAMVLVSFGYDLARVERMVALGEPV